MMSGRSKEAMDVAVESIEERQARVQLWDKVKSLVSVATEQVMALIEGLVPRKDEAEMVNILHFSCEHTAALLERAGEPLDEKAVWQSYDNSMKLLDIVVLLPSEWTKLLTEASAWRSEPPKYVNEPHVPPIGRRDFERLKKMPGKHQLHLPQLAAFEPKYKIPA